jgi:hypothetical protein
VAWGNYYNNSGVETDGVNDITVRASIEYPAATFTPLYFSGKRDIVINAGGTASSDYLPISIPAGAQFWTRTYVTVADNTKRWPLNGSYQAGLAEGSTNSAGETDKTTTGTLTGGGFGFGPHAVVAKYLPTGTARIIGIGDSRITGNGDTDVINGWWGRAFEGRCINQRISYPVEKAQTFATNAGRYRRMPLIEGSNVAICNYGVNDLSGGRTLAQLQADVITIWQICQARGIAVYHTTIEPSTTSTDSWATLANQTILSWNTSRVSFNNWLRDGAPIASAANPTAVAAGAAGLRMGGTGHPLLGYLEMADVVESSRDSGKWKVNGSANFATADGLHQTPAFHILQAAVPIAAGIDQGWVDS